MIHFASASKADVPSGTSHELAETSARSAGPTPQARLRSADSAVPLPDLHGPVEARGTEIAGTRIHSVHLPGFVVTTEIVSGKAGEKLTMRHDPGTNPGPYAAGNPTGHPQGHRNPRSAPRPGLPALRAVSRGVSPPWGSRADRRFPAVGP
ncbi:dihydrodipicolinate reductase C-terminal domain-containing protein [Saccharopolyspora spinosa]|uniref:dihydrodipicolinate reductase C-terminal domain-containing protein n=1 Tax=Saccharopolyspora spinosa TaxID=60894 RepID=UPI003B43A04C